LKWVSKIKDMIFNPIECCNFMNNTLTHDCRTMDEVILSRGFMFDTDQVILMNE